MIDGHSGKQRVDKLRSLAPLAVQALLRLRGGAARLLPALANAIATACLIAFFLVGGWLVPIEPSFFHSSTSVLILLLTTGWADPFLNGMNGILGAPAPISVRCNA